MTKFFDYRSIMKKIIFVIIPFMIVFNCGLCYGAEGKDYKRVLFISSYSYSWDAVQVQIEGINSKINDDIILDYEFMDTKRISNKEWIDEFYRTLKYKLSIVQKYDVVIVGDDAGLGFAMEHRNDIFENIPILFEGINSGELIESALKMPMVMGVEENLSFNKNIDLALSFYPEAENVVAILDDTPTGQAERNSFYKNSELYPNLKFSEINTSALSTEKLKRAIAEVDENSILIYIVMTEDADGRQYSNNESIQLIADNARVPAFRMVSGGIGKGLLGGNIVSMKQSGEIVAELANKIVNGEGVEYGTCIDSPNIYCLDENVMRKYGMNLACVPKGAEVLNHIPTFMEKYEAVFLPLSIIIVLLVIILLISLRDIQRKKKMMKELSRSKQLLAYLNLHDSLTGIGNRNKLNEDLPECLKNNVSCSVMMMDIDDFKIINDSHGHSIGDEVLKQVGLRLEKIANDELTPYRFAGDEFVIIVRSNDRKIVERLAKKILKAMNVPFKINNTSYTVSVSIGIAISNGINSMPELIDHADVAMYSIKKSGKNSYNFYER